MFESVSAYCFKLSESMPVALVLGFFVQIVVDRWISQLWLLPWPDRLAMLLSAYVCDEPEQTDVRLAESRPHSIGVARGVVQPAASDPLALPSRTDGHSISTSSSVSNVPSIAISTVAALLSTPPALSGPKKGVETGYIHELLEQRAKEEKATVLGTTVPDDQSRLIRRTVVRYVLAAFAMLLCSISTQVKKRFPTDEHLVNAGLLRSDELDTINKRFSPTFGGRTWIPIVWAINLVARARRQGRIRSDIALKACLHCLFVYRLTC